MTTRIAIIPARGGSKRIPNKNIRSFCGKPMISYVLKAAQASGLFDVIHVSTESGTIRRTVEDLGFPVDFERPIDLADDYTPIMPVLKYVVDTYESKGKRFDQVWMLMACAPLINHRDLKEASELFERSGGRDALLAVTEYPAPIEWAFCRGDDAKLIPAQPGMFAARSQDLQKKYFDAGSFAAFPVERVRNSHGAGADSGFIGFVMPKGRSIDIDDEDDWILAEELYRIRSR
jgi:pseudaminic acid cytidylyltransferase